MLEQAVASCDAPPRLPAAHERDHGVLPDDSVRRDDADVAEHHVRLRWQPPPEPVRPAVQRLLEALSELAADPPRGRLVDGEALLRAGEVVQALGLREVAAVDRAGTHLEQGHGTTASWVRQTLRTTDETARGIVRLAGRLEGDLAPARAVVMAGGMTLAHVKSIAAGVRGIAPDVVADSLPALLAAAASTDPRTLARELRERAASVSNQLAREQARRQRERRGLWLSELLDGSFVLRGTLTAEAGQVLQTAMDALVHGRREASDRRDLPQRRADALVELVAHTVDCQRADLPDRSGGRAQVCVLVTAERLLGRPGATPATFPASQALLDDRALLRLTCDADVARVVLTPDGVVLDLGRTTRTVTGGQWRALVARDRSCVVRGCSRRPGQCQAHHVRHWSRGGRSDLDNYALLCHAHHHEVHDLDAWLRHRDGRWLTPDGFVGDPDPPPPEPLLPLLR